MPKKSKGDAQKLIDRILDFPYRKLFGVRGQITIGTIVVFVFIIKFFSGIDTVMLDAKTCKVSIWDTPYLLFHKERSICHNELLYLIKKVLYFICASDRGASPTPASVRLRRESGSG